MLTEGAELGTNACLFTEDFELKGVFARGREMMRDGEILVKGTFEY